MIGPEEMIMYCQDILDRMVESSKEIFKEALTGVYLHGSLAMGCFNPKKSDIDLIIMIEQDITDEQKLAFMSVVTKLNEQAPQKGIEMSVVKKEYCKEFVYPTPYELHFSNAHLQWFQENPTDYIAKMKGTDKDLAAHFTIINRYGKTLYGEKIADVFGEVPREDYLDSIMYDINDAKECMMENPVYFILNLCRVAAYVKEDLVLSKAQGGEWGLENLDPKYRSLIQNALDYYTSDMGGNIEEETAKSFCDDMLKLIENNISGER